MPSGYENGPMGVGVGVGVVVGVLVGVNVSVGSGVGVRVGPGGVFVMNRIGSGLGVLVLKSCASVGALINTLMANPANTSGAMRKNRVISEDVPLVVKPQDSIRVGREPG